MTETVSPGHAPWAESSYAVDAIADLQRLEQLMDEGGVPMNYEVQAEKDRRAPC